MNEFFTTLQKQARILRLSQPQKQAMRVHLYEVIETSPALSAAQKSAMQDFKNRKAVPSLYHWFSPRFSIPLAVVLLVGLSSGTVFAAQSALPGQPLYAVKVNVNEPVAVALATTPAAKAEVNASIATTRLEEAETLASNGTLTASTTAELASNFAEHASAAEANTVAVAAADPGTAAQLGTTFSSTLAAHSAILAQLGTDAGSSTVQTSSDALAVQVLAQAVGDINQNQEGSGAPLAVAIQDTAQNNTSDNAQSASTTPAAASANTPSPTQVSIALNVSAPVDASSTATAPGAPKVAVRVSSGRTTIQSSQDGGVVALALEAQASSTLSQVEVDFAALQPSLNASTSLQIQNEITAANQMFADGSNALIGSDTSTANNDFSRVLRMSVRLDAFLKAGQKFNPAFLTSLLK